MLRTGRMTTPRNPAEFAEIAGIEEHEARELLRIRYDRSTREWGLPPSIEKLALQVIRGELAIVGFFGADFPCQNWREAAIDQANERTLEETDGVVWSCWLGSGVGRAYFAPPETARGIKAALENYPVLSDETLCEVENEILEEEWQDGQASETMRVLAREITQCLIASMDLPPDFEPDSIIDLIRFRCGDLALELGFRAFCEHRYGEEDNSLTGYSMRDESREILGAIVSCRNAKREPSGDMCFWATEQVEILEFALGIDSEMREGLASALNSRIASSTVGAVRVRREICEKILANCPPQFRDGDNLVLASEIRAMSETERKEAIAAYSLEMIRIARELGRIE